MLSTRPKVAELVFVLYGRQVHPELFVHHRRREVERGGYRAEVSITSSGHVVYWRYDDHSLTEVCSSAQNPLPERYQLLAHPLRGERNARKECVAGVTYESSFSLDTVQPEAFHTFQKELLLAGAKEGMLQKFNSSGRFGAGGLSYINLMSRDRMLKVQALHTYPDDYAIVKTQSVFRLPE